MLAIRVNELKVPSFAARAFEGPEGATSFATQAVAEAGASLTVVMSPGRTTDLIRHTNSRATTLLIGTVLLATKAEVLAGDSVSDVDVVTAEAVKQLVFIKRGSLANDAVVSFPVLVNQVGQGFLSISTAACSTSFVWDTRTTHDIQVMAEGSSGSSLIEYSTSVLTAGSGTDGKVTVSCANAGGGISRIYISNRLPSTHPYNLILMGASA